MTAPSSLAGPKLSRLLAAYVDELDKLEVVLAGLDAAGLVTFKAKQVVAARAFAQQHLLALEADTFSPKQEARLVRQLENPLLPEFSLDEAFENPRGSAVDAFHSISKVWNVLNNFVFSEDS